MLEVLSVVADENITLLRNHLFGSLLILIKMAENIIPFCYYEHVQGNSIILNPSQKKDGNDNIMYSCHPGEGGWELKRTFFAVNPMLRPIPIGMKLYGIDIGGTPQRITNIEIVYGLFNVYPETLYLIAYNRRVSNTIPLYFYKENLSIQPSFIFDDNKQQVDFSPIYVLDNLDYSSFRCYDGRCLPVNKNDGEGPVYSLDECVIGCNELIPAEWKSPNNVLDILSKKENKNDLIPITITISVAFFFIFLFRMIKS